RPSGVSSGLHLGLHRSRTDRRPGERRRAVRGGPVLLPSASRPRGRPVRDPGGVVSSPWVSRLRHASTIASAVVVPAVLCAIACRITFPLELEWMEGGLLHQAQRLQRGLPIYPPPGPDFVPFLYTPLYPTVLAAPGSVVGRGCAVGRLVSVLACLAIALAIARAVHHEGKPRAHLVAAIGLFASGYVFTFRWYDVARPDMLYLALVLWGLVFLHEAGRDGRAEHRKA